MAPRRDTVVGSGSLVTLDPGATKREIARSFPVQTRGHYRRREALDPQRLQRGRGFVHVKAGQAFPEIGRQVRRREQTAVPASRWRHCCCHFDRAFGWVGAWHRIVKEHHDPVTRELIERTLELADQRPHAPWYSRRKSRTSSGSAVSVKAV